MTPTCCPRYVTTIYQCRDIRVTLTVNGRALVRPLAHVSILGRYRVKGRGFGG
jgi:hypothetical protein